jgi:Cysteine-rich secretory protein family/LysM domain
MGQKALLLFAGLFCLLMTVSVVSAQDEVSDLLGRINNLRATKGLPAYTLNGSLAAAAQSQSQWLIDHNCAIAHVHPDGSSPRSRAQAAGYASIEVSENIYCGGLATVDDAWTFWINSPIHYAGLVNTRYKEIGIGVVHGANGSGFTLVFGNPGGPDFVPPAPAGSSANAGAPSQPSYVVGVDEHGNIEHEIQPGDTIGDILLIYGYTWADIPTLLALNNMTQADFRSLKVGTILLIPPKAGTYTPTPGDAPTATPEAPTAEPTDAVPTATDAPTETPLPPEPTALPPTADAVVQAAAIVPSSTATLESAAPTAVAFVATSVPAGAPKSAGVVTPSSNNSPALVIALVVQVAILLGAGFEFIRRMRRRNR